MFFNTGANTNNKVREHRKKVLFSSEKSKYHKGFFSTSRKSSKYHAMCVSAIRVFASLTGIGPVEH